MKKIFTLLVLSFVLLSTNGFSQVVTRLLGSSPFQDSLWFLDTTNWQVVRRIGPTPNVGGAFTGMNSIARNPVTGTVFVINKQSAVSGRVLGKLDPLSGVVTIVGNLGDNFSSIAFTSDQKLYACTGDGASVPETLYQIDTATAAKRLVKTLGNGADGEIISWNPTDNLLYHWSGNGTIVYEKMDTVTGPYNFTNIPIIGTTSGETFGAVYIGNNTFLTSNISSAFNRFAATGNCSASFGSNPDDLRGMAFITCPRSITGTLSFCTGGSTTLTAGSTGPGYQWYMNGVLLPGETAQTYVVTAAGHYNCRISDACGTDSSGAGVNVIVNPLPTVTASSTAGTVCAGTSVTLTGGGASTYTWTGGVTDAVPFVPVSTSSYTVTGTDANGCMNTAATSVVVNPLPTVVANSTSSAVCAGTSVTLTGSGAISYTWDNSVMDGVAFVPASTIMYTVTGTDANGCMNTDMITVTVNPLPVVALGADVVQCAGSVMFDAQNAGSTYLWSDGSTTQTITVSTSGTYSVVVTDANGCMNSDTVMATINALPIVDLGSDVTQCGGTVTLDAQNVGSTYLWSDASVNQTLVVSTTGNYFCSVTDANGCSSSDTVMITINIPPSVTGTAASLVVCVDDAADALTGTPNGGTWSGAGVTGSSFDPGVAGIGNHTLTYSFTDVNNCTSTATVDVLVNACVGIDEHASVNGTSLFPNPSNGNVQIMLTDASLVTVYNSIGQSVMTVQLTDGTHTLDMTGFAEGTYFVHTQNSKGVSTQRLMISK
jgi:hypothetical protein